MAVALDTNGLRLRFRAVPSHADTEEAQWSVYTGKRNPSDYTDLAALMQSHIDNLWAQNVFRDASVLEFFVDQWQTPVLSADSWGNAYRQVGTPPPPTAGGVPLPLQNALVVSRQCEDIEIQQNRSYNRCYLPMLDSSILDGAGGATSAARTAIIDEFVRFDAALRVVPLDGSPDELGGLCNVSYKGTPTVQGTAQIMATRRLWVGRWIDTQRSRRAQIVETRGNEVGIPGGGVPTTRPGRFNPAIQPRS